VDVVRRVEAVQFLPLDLAHLVHIARLGIRKELLGGPHPLLRRLSPVLPPMRLIQTPAGDDRILSSEEKSSADDTSAATLPAPEKH
jgi:hypothetical protein